MTKLTDARRHRAELAEASKFKEMFNKCRAALDDTEIDLAKALAENERLQDHLRWILPLAKGYAAAHQVGRNAVIVANAEAALAPEGKEAP